MTTPFPFVSGTVLTAQQLNDIQNLPISDKVASYVLIAGDETKRTIINSASATTITVNNSIFTVGDVVQISNKGSGSTVITAGAGVTINTSGSLTLPQYASGFLVALSASTFLFFNPAAASITSATVQTNSSQTTTSTSYADLATVTSVTLTTGTTAFASWQVSASHNELNGSTFVSVAVSGATTVAASDNFCALGQSPAAGGGLINIAGGHIFTGLTAGSNTFTLKYRNGGGGQTSTLNYRGLQVINL